MGTTLPGGGHGHRDLLARAFAERLVRWTSIADLCGRDTTPARLMALAEDILGREGIGAVSLKMLAERAGSANKSAVQYHFRDRDSLIRAVFEVRMRQIDERRGFYLDHALAGGATPDLRTLGTVLLLPYVEQVGPGSEQSFCRFFLQFLSGFTPWNGVINPIYVLPDSHSARAFSYVTGAVPALSARTLRRRSELLAHIPLAAMVERENRQRRMEPVAPIEGTLGACVDLWAAGMRAGEYPRD